MSNTLSLINRLALMMICLLLPAPAARANTPQTNEPRDLPPGRTLERETAGAETHRYSIKLAKDEFFQICVEQKGVDVVLKLTDAAGHVLATMDSPNGKQGPETLSYVAAKPGGFTLEVSNLDAKMEKGQYSIRRETARAATAKDKRRVEVELLFAAGMTAKSKEGEAAVAIAKLEGALKGWQELEDDYLAGLTEQQVKEIKLGSRITALIAEFGVPGKLVTEGQGLLREGKPESVLAARAKFVEAVKSAREFFKKLDGENLSDILTGEDRADWKLITKINEVNALSAISTTHDASKNWQESVNYSKLALQVIREMLQDPEISASKALVSYPLPPIVNEASLLSNTCSTLTNSLDNPQEGLSYCNQALALWHKVKLQHEKYRVTAEYKEAITLQTMGQGHISLDDRGKALAAFEQALAIFRRLPGQKSMEAETLLQIANLYSRRLDYKKARESWAEALKIYEELGDKQSQAGVLAQIGLSYFSVKDEQKAREYFNRELAILLSDDYFESSMKERSAMPLPGFKGDTAFISNFYKDNFEWERSINIGGIYNLLGEDEKAREHYEKSLASAYKTKKQGAIRLSLSFLGDIQSKRENWQKALEYYKPALEISRQLPAKSDVASDLSSLAYINIQMKNWQAALQHAVEALLIYRSLGADKGNLFLGYASILNTIARAQDELGHRSLAIFYEKQAVNAIQRERQQLKNLDQQSQRGYLKNSEKIYQRLADWLIAEGRLTEAEQVLDMFKQEEVFDYLRRDASEADKLQLRSDLSAEERDALGRYNKIGERIAAIGAEYDGLRQLRQRGATLTAEQQARYEELTKEVADANNIFQAFLKQLENEFARRGLTRRGLEEDLALQSQLKDWGEGVVFLYTLVGEDRYRVILTTPRVKTDGKHEIKSVDLDRKISDFRQIVQNPALDPKPLGTELYDILIRPVEKQLEGAKAKTLLWSLDGNLRLLPLAALWDGRQFFGQKYQNVIFTPASRSRLGEANSPNWRVLGAGVSEPRTVSLKELDGASRSVPFPELPAVKTELAKIVADGNGGAGALPGAVLLNSDFSKKNFTDHLLKGYKAIHIASHFALNAGDASRSFLLLGDGSALPVSEIKTDPDIDFAGVDLLTLSACQTAVVEKDSNGKEVEGFGYIAQQKGAKAILASLWPVTDESTSLLMGEFYRLRKQRPQLTKAAALRLAQQAMLEGKLRPSAEGGRRGMAQKKTGAATYEHPYYWSPFILIGNWR